MTFLEKEAQECDTLIFGLFNWVDKLKASVNSISDCLCHYSEEKKKGIIKREKEDVELEYTSNNGYFPALEATMAAISKLISFNPSMGSREAILEDGNESCGCGVEEHPIIFSNDILIENEVPITGDRGDNTQ